MIKLTFLCFIIFASVFFCDFSKISSFFVEFFENLFDNKQNLIDKDGDVICITNFLMK